MNDINQNISDHNCPKNSVLASQNVGNNHILAKNCFITRKNKFSIDKQKYLHQMFWGQSRGSNVMGPTSRASGPGLDLLDTLNKVCIF